MSYQFFFDARRAKDFAGGVDAGPRPGDLHLLETVTTPVGERIEHFQQYFRGLPVYGGAQTVIHHGGSRTVTGQCFNVPENTDVRPAHAVSAAVATVEAFMRAKRLMPANGRLRVVRVFEDASLPPRPAFAFLSARAEGPMRAHLQVCPVGPNSVRLVWVMTWGLKDRRRFQALVTANRGKPRVLKLAQVNACSFHASWTPIPDLPPESGSWPQPPLDTPTGLPGTATAWQTTPGWADGPNVVCFRPKPRTVLPLDDGEVDNTFVWTNLLHDFCAAFGFDSQSWAFDGLDRLQVFRLTERNKAAGDFFNFADGASPQMRLFASPHGGSHAAADPTIVIHEYFHGVCSRLVGGAAVSEPFTTHEAQGLVEGICDYFAVTILGKVARARPQAPPVTRIGPLFKPGTGIRDYAGSPTSMPTKIPKDIYRTGQIWCAAVLEARGILAATYGDDNADRFVWATLFGMLRRLNTTAPPSKDHFTLPQCRTAIASAGAIVEHAMPVMAGATTQLLASMATRNV